VRRHRSARPPQPREPALAGAQHAAVEVVRRHVGLVHLPAVLADAFGVSRSEARRLIAQGGVRLDDEVVAEADVAADDLDGRVLRAGKRRFARLRRAG
jgi:tyrosyl-tRNA synthetase